MQSGALRIVPEEVDFNAVVGVEIERVREDAARRGSTLALHVDETVRGQWDRASIVRVVSAILSNAVRFGAGKPIDVSLATETRLDGDRARRIARLVVIDRGIGIAPERQGEIFQRLVRGVSARNYGGLGLGLYLARVSLDRLKGTVKVHSDVGAGATFTVELPLSGD